MFYGIINAILGSLGGIVYKKSLVLMNGIISNKFYLFLSSFFTIIFGFILYIFFDFQVLNLNIFLMLLGTAFLGIFAELFEQYAYVNEKINILVPYGEFKSIFTIIFGFIFFTDNSIISFIFTIIAGIILILGSIDFKKLSFNKYCLALIFSSFFGTFKIILFGFILKYLAEYNAFFYNTVIVFLVLLIISISNKEIKKIKDIKFKKYNYIIIENFIRFIVGMISLFIMKELGIIQAVLIGMLYMVFSIIFAYIFFKEKISKKELIIVILVLLCIGGGMIFG